MKTVFFFCLFLCTLSAAPTVYVQNLSSGDVSLIDPLTDMNLVGSPLMVGSSPRNFAASPDQSRIYLTNANSDSVSVIDTITNTTLMTINLTGGDGPDAIAITPDGSRLYVACPTGDNVKMIDTTTFAVTTIGGFSFPNSVGITPDGTEVYVSNPGMMTGPNVKVIDNTLVVPVVSVTISDAGITGPNLLAITPNGQQVYVTNPSTTVVNAINVGSHAVTNITVGNGPFCVAITHDGSRVYVPCANATRVDVIDTSLNSVVSSIVSPMLLDTPVWAAVMPDDSKVYVAIQNTGSVGVITNSPVPPTMLTGSPITVGTTPQFLAITPDGSKVFVTNSGSADVSTIDTATDTIETLSIPVGTTPIHIAFAGFTNPTPPGNSVTGYQTTNQFLTQTDRINVISWTEPSTGGPFVKYLIYRDPSFTILAGEVLVGQPLEFEDHNRKKGETYSYYVVAVDDVGGTTSVGSVSLN